MQYQALKAQAAILEDVSEVLHLKSMQLSLHVRNHILNDEPIIRAINNEPIRSQAWMVTKCLHSNGQFV